MLTMANRLRAGDSGRATARFEADFAGPENARRSPETGDLEIADSDGCGGPQPAEFGVLLGRGIASVRRTVPAKRARLTDHGGGGSPG